MSQTISSSARKLPLPRDFLLSAKSAVLGQHYALSVAFVKPDEMRRLNRTYRRKRTPTDILSFPLSKKEGEIVFCLAEVRKQARVFQRTPQNFLRFLLIHGLLHLKGMRHGSTMERQERKIREKFNI